MVEIAFCFSQDMWKQAGVSVTSLLRSGGGENTSLQNLSVLLWDCRITEKPFSEDSGQI